MPPARGERERAVGREDPLARRGALRVAEVQQRRVGAIAGPQRQDGHGGRAADGQAALLPWAVRDGVQRGSVVGLDTRDAGVDARLRERRLELAEHGHEHISRGGGDGGVRRRATPRVSVVRVRFRATIDGVEGVMDR